MSSGFLFRAGKQLQAMSDEDTPPGSLAPAARDSVCTEENKQVHAESETCVYVGYQITTLGSLVRINFEETEASVPWTVGSKTFNFDQHAQPGFTILAKVSLQDPNDTGIRVPCFRCSHQLIPVPPPGVHLAFMLYSLAGVTSSCTCRQVARIKNGRKNMGLGYVDGSGVFAEFDVSTLTVKMKLGSSNEAGGSAFDSGLGYEDYDQERTLDLIHVGRDCTNTEFPLQTWAPYTACLLRKGAKRRRTHDRVCQTGKQHRNGSRALRLSIRTKKRPWTLS